MLEHWLCVAEGPYQVCVDPQMGGRIVEYSIAGNNALHTEGPAQGSTFWPSPQDDWGWPPPAVLDQDSYTSVVEGNTITLTSDVCPQTGLQVGKRIALLNDRLDITYTMLNPGKSVLRFAPWEITRIGGGETFYQSQQPPLTKSTGRVELSEGFIWHQYSVETQKENEKIFGNDSSGWLANYYRGLLLIKRFPPVAANRTAPGEAEIEIYGHGDKHNPYIEVEQQGEYQDIAPGTSVSWTVAWYLKALPRSDISRSRKQLTEWVADVLE